MNLISRRYLLTLRDAWPDILLSVILHGHLLVAFVALLLIMSSRGLPDFEGAPRWLSSGLFVGSIISGLLSLTNRLGARENQVFFGLSAIAHVLVFALCATQLLFGGVTAPEIPSPLLTLYNLSVGLCAIGFLTVVAMAFFAMVTPLKSS